MAAQCSTIQLAEELCELPLLLNSKLRAPLSATDLSELRWETRQAVLLALLAEVPGSPAAPALQQLVAKRRAARRAERELERRARPEELGMLPAYVRAEEDGFRRSFMALVGEELARQAPPKPLLAAAADPARLVADRGLCLRVIDFLAARHRSRARTLAGLQQRILASSPAPPSPIVAAEPGAAAESRQQPPRGSSSSSKRDKAAVRRDVVATTPMQQRPPSPLVVEPTGASADRRRRTTSSSSSRHAKTPMSAAAAAAGVAELSSPLLRQGMRRLSLQGAAAPLWSQEEGGDAGYACAVGMVEEAVVAAAARSERRRRSGSSKTSASKVVEEFGVGEVARALHSEDPPLALLHPTATPQQQAKGNKPRKSTTTTNGGIAMKVKGKALEDGNAGVGLAELLPPVRRPEAKREVKVQVPRATATEEEGVGVGAAGGDANDEEVEADLRAENARLRAALKEATALYEALMRGGGGGGGKEGGGVDARVLAVVEQQSAMLAREAAGLRGEVEGYRDLAEGVTVLLGGLEACLQEVLAEAEAEAAEGGSRRRRDGARSSSSAFWAAALAEARQLHGRWRSAKRAGRAKHQHGLLLPRDARVFLRRPAERLAGGGVDGDEASAVPLSGEWEDRARLRGNGAAGDEASGDGGLLLDMARVRGLGARLAGLATALEAALEQQARPAAGALGAAGLGPLLDQARALRLQLAQLGLVSTAAGGAAASAVGAAKGLTRERVLLEAFDALLVPRLRPQELRERVEGLRRLVMAERGALARGMATAVEEAVGLRRAGVAGAAGVGSLGGEEEEGGDGFDDEDEGEEGSYVEEETEEAPVLDRRLSGNGQRNGQRNGHGNGARRAVPSGVRPQWV